MSDETEPFAWAVIGDDYAYATLLAEHAGAVAEEEGGRVVPLYRSPTLTAAEREAIEAAIDLFRNWVNGTDDDEREATLCGLLERTK